MYNGALCAVSPALYQSAGSSPAVQLTDVECNAIPVGVPVISFAVVNGGANVYVLLSNKDLIYWNGSWSLSRQNATALDGGQSGTFC